MTRATPRKILRLKERAKLVARVNNIVDIGDLRGSSGHLSCFDCKCPWFEVDVSGCNVIFGCASCGDQIRCLLPRQLDQQGLLMCPDCNRHNKQMVAITNVDVICVGCRYCKWQLISSLRIDNEIQLLN